jgi:peptide methionine sulfoxide reductase msrA/msrB
LGMGCFWGAEKRMSEMPGVLDVESGYANGEIAGTYDAVLAQERALQLGLSKQLNHAEVVKVRFDPAVVDVETVLAKFWESHDPTQGNRQGNDLGTNYRSAIYVETDADLSLAQQMRDVYQGALKKSGFGEITTDIALLKSYFTAEEYHQNYLQKNPDGYCGLGGTGVRFPMIWLGKRLLSEEQYAIAFAQGTERPFCAANLTEKRKGVFVDPLTGVPLFRSEAKFESGTGWPSFFTPLEGSITRHEDSSHGMKRVEVRSASSGIHLGHVFDDGPPPSHQRYCINGNVLKFIPD